MAQGRIRAGARVDAQRLPRADQVGVSAGADHEPGFSPSTRPTSGVNRVVSEKPGLDGHDGES